VSLLSGGVMCVDWFGGISSGLLWLEEGFGLATSWDKETLLALESGDSGAAFLERRFCVFRPLSAFCLAQQKTLLSCLLPRFENSQGSETTYRP